VPDTVKVFVSYSHQDARYLEDNSLLGFLRGLEKEGIEFWTDRNLRPGELWDEVIKNTIQDSPIALVLVSQYFLDSAYCQNVEIQGFLANKAHLFPIILSPCEWERHDWLKNRQFLPGGQETIVEHYTEAGKRERLFLKIRQYLREQVDQVRQVRTALAPSPGTPVGPPAGAHYPGKTKLAFCDRLGDDWRKLADYLEIPPADQSRFERGDQGRGIWVWLENRKRLDILPEALTFIGRQDLTGLLQG
jgi:hypothetical protein